MSNPDLVLFDPKVEARVFTVGTTPTKIIQGPARFLLRNRGTNLVYLGGAGVDASNGMDVFPNSDPIPMSLAPGAWLYAVTPTGTTEVVILVG